MEQSFSSFEEAFSSLIKGVHMFEFEAFSMSNKADSISRMKSSTCRIARQWDVNKSVIIDVCKKLIQSKSVELDFNENTMFIQTAIPERFFVTEDIYYAHYNGTFLRVVIDNDKRIFRFFKDEYQPQYLYFDFSANKSYRSLLTQLKNTEEAIDTYISSVTYDKRDYIIEKEVPVYEGIFDPNFSFTKEEMEACNDWAKKHEKKFHKKDKPVICAGMCSRYHFRFDNTNLGIFKTVYCEDCLKNKKDDKESSFCCNLNDI